MSPIEGKLANLQRQESKGCGNLAAHGDGMWPSFVDLVGMTSICCLTSSTALQGFLGDLARSLCKDAIQSDVLQMLDKHYGVIMTFNALSKELYSLKQGSNENVAEFGICLFQQVQILQSEYPGRIQQEHVEEMKCMTTSMKVLVPNTSKCWLIKWKMKHHSQLLQLASSCTKAGKMDSRPGTLLPPKTGCN